MVTETDTVQYELGRLQVACLFSTETGRDYLQAEFNRTLIVVAFDEDHGRAGMTDYRKGYLAALAIFITEAVR